MKIEMFQHLQKISMRTLTQQVLIYTNTVILCHNKGHWKWYMIAETTGAYNSYRDEQEQMIHICQMYRTSSKPFPLHNQPPQTFEPLQATLQQKESTRSSLPITLCSWVNIRVIQTGIKLYSLVVLSTIPSLKQIGSQVSQHRTMLNIYFIKSCQQSSLPWILWPPPPPEPRQINFIQTDSKNFWESGHRMFLIYHTNGTLNEGQGQTDIKM